MKLFSAVTLIGLCLALAGCGSSGGGDGGATPAARPGNSGGTNSGGTTTNPVGEPGPEGSYACYMVHRVAGRQVTTCAETEAGVIPQDEARRICTSMRTPTVDVVWNDRGCSPENHIGTCIGTAPEGGVTIKVRYYDISEEEARQACLGQNPQNQFTTEY